MTFKWLLNFLVWETKEREEIQQKGGLPLPLHSLDSLDHHRNIASLILFCRYYFGRCSYALAELVSFRYSCGRSTSYFEILHDFSVTIPTW